MASKLSLIRKERIQKIDDLKKLGLDPYPAKSYRDTDIKNIVSDFEKFENKEVVVAGRIVSWRGHGKLVFADLKDMSGKLQLFIKDDVLSKTNSKENSLGFEDLKLLDIGDFIETTGKVIKTSSGEISVEAKKIRLLSKTIRPIPETWDGLKDKEVRFRRRYLDTSVNKDVFDRFIRRAKFWEAHREFFKSRGFLEMNIPVLEHIPGGGDANPFITHMDAIDQDFYLRISQELYLKRLIGGGYEKVYEIGPRFRNEGLSDEHLPEHMAMEFYWAYADWKDGMKMVQELYTFVLKNVYEGKEKLKIRGFDVDFSKEWEKIDFGEIMKSKFAIDAYEPDFDELKKVLKKNNLDSPDIINIPRAIDTLWKSIRKDIAGPAFLINHPKYLSPLQKVSDENPLIVERFQPIIAGSELGNGWTEVNDPLDQYARFSEQQKMRDSGDKEAQWLDIDYVEMLEYGMPPTFGYGHSERVFWFLEDVTAREGVPFPQLKFEIDESTKEIYPDLKITLPKAKNK